MDIKLGFTVREECKLKISENRLLRRMHVPKWKLWEDKGNATPMHSSVTYILNRLRGRGE
jgi:hypothetical protein